MPKSKKKKTAAKSSVRVINLNKENPLGQQEQQPNIQVIHEIIGITQTTQPIQTKNIVTQNAIIMQSTNNSQQAHASHATHTDTHFDNVKATQQIETYTVHDKAPFYIMMEKKDINEIEISKYLIKVKITGIEEIRKLSKFKLRVKVKSRDSANDILNNKVLRSMQKINSYIPSQFVKTVGIVRGVPLDVTNEEIEEYLESPVPVESYERLSYWDKDSKCAKPGTSLKLTFRSTTLPREIKIFYVVKRVDYFIPRPILCRNCLRYGHTARVCKNTKESLCNNCTEVTHAVSDKSCNKQCVHCIGNCATKCKFCNTGNHRTSSKDCPEMVKQTQIKEKMIKEKMSFVEARNLVQNGSQEKSTYANVTSLMELNKSLLGRMKDTEQMLRIIVDAGHARCDEQSGTAAQVDSSTIEYIMTKITRHFQKYHIEYSSAQSHAEGEEMDM